MQKSEKIVMILGPTASGKTACAVRLADRINAEIVSADSRQIYRGMDIGSGKDLEEYRRPDGSRIPAHMLDIADPAGPVFTLADYLCEANRVIAEITARNRLPLVVGGSALYLHGLLKGYELRGGPPDDENRAKLRAMDLDALHETLRAIDPQDPILLSEPGNRTRLIRRIEMLRAPGGPVNEKEIPPDSDRSFLILGVLRNRKEIHESIQRRLDERLANGMLEEAVRLHDRQGVSWEAMEFFGLEYRFMALHLQGKLSLDEMRDSLLCKIRQFAKRQDSWFRKFENDGCPVHWLRPYRLDDAERLCRDFLAGRPLPAPDFRLADCKYPVHPEADSGGNGKKVR